jgi:hypothetical protein
VARVSSSAQRTRTQKDPLVIGTFDALALRYLTGTLGPKNQLIGYADTNSTSNGGYGGGTYNHWFQINILSPAWIIITKGGPRPQYIQTSFYDINFNPIQGRGIFDADSVTTDGAYFPYLNTAMAAGSDLYNQYSRLRLDRGDERYYPLPAGSYLLCVSSTRNELLDYAVGVIVEFPAFEGFFELEDGDGSVVLQETEINADNISSPVTVNTLIPPGANAFTQALCSINSGVTVTVSPGSTWLIGFAIPSGDFDDYKIFLEVGDEGYWDTIHDHSLAEWRNAWIASHPPDDLFPDLFIPLTDRP